MVFIMPETKTFKISPTNPVKICNRDDIWDARSVCKCKLESSSRASVKIYDGQPLWAQRDTFMSHLVYLCSHPHYKSVISRNRINTAVLKIIEVRCMCPPLPLDNFIASFFHLVPLLTSGINSFGA